MVKTPPGSTYREIALVDLLQSLGGSARTGYLAQALDVSEETIRRTVKKLSKNGVVTRVHGGVYFTAEDASPKIFRRIGEHAKAKRRLAKMAAPLVSDGSSVFLGIGSTSTFIAEALRAKKDLLVVTNSIAVAQTLMRHNGNRVFIAGGELQRDECGTFGADVLQFIGRFKIDIAILSVDAVDASIGFLLSDPAEAEVARLVISKARTSVVATDHSKIGASAPIVAASPDDIDIFVGDRALPDSVQTAMAGWGIDILVAPDRLAKPVKGRTCPP